MPKIKAKNAMIKHKTAVEFVKAILSFIHRDYY
jgi:hypothetical protein